MKCFGRLSISVNLIHDYHGEKSSFLFFNLCWCSDLVTLLGGAVAGIHSMTDGHFGISVVEYMAAGVIPIG